MEKNGSIQRRFLSLGFYRGLTKERYLYLGVMIGLIIIATVISSGHSKDSENYNRMFELYGASGWGALNAEMLQREVFFLFVSKLVYQLGLSSAFLFLIYSSISIPVKFYLIDKHSKAAFLSLAYFCSYFFILHDCTQLRFGMAVAFAYLGLHFLADNKRLVFSAIVILSAILFHNAILVFLVMLLFTSRKSLTWLLVMVAVAILLYPINLNAVMLNLVGNLIDYFRIEGSGVSKVSTGINRLHAYLLRPSSDMHLGIFSRHGLMIYAYAIIIFKYRNVFNKYEYLCYNAFILSIFFWILMKDSMDLQVRFNDAFGFSLVFLIPYVHRRISEYVGERNAYILLLLFFTAYLSKFIFYDKMVTF